MAAFPFSVFALDGTLIPTVALGPYRKYWLDRRARIHNPKFDSYSKLILALKDTSDFKHKAAVAHFTKLLLDYLASDTTIGLAELVIVPSSKANQVSPGLVSIVGNVCKRDRRFVYRHGYLYRDKTIDKLAGGGARSHDVHLNSLACKLGSAPGVPLKIIIDDVATTGKSLGASRAVLWEHARCPVRCIVLGRTTDD